MRTHILLLLMVASVLLISAFSNKSDKQLEKTGFRFIPAGELQLTNTSKQVTEFYLFETEITNRQYAEFLNSLLKSGKTEDYRICKIDSAAWDKVLNFDNSYAEEYHLTAEFADYPVVNISYEAAELFCIWLEKKLGKKARDFDIRLPSEDEWVYAAKGGKQDAQYPWENMSRGSKKDVDFCNYNSPDDGTCLATNYAKSYYSNAYGLYNMSGNVAEMLHPKGATKGGSWNSNIMEMNITAGDSFAGVDFPSPYIGFRPVAVAK
ncbi:MAG: SUMF1/EgtB/PvdO family nonheme iron enzyme [Chitinophagales bacterium]|nr:SUMF1/EgtB/PvdO family nonheme iron enzyme [Chitinophagales bacterium]